MPRTVIPVVTIQDSHDFRVGRHSRPTVNEEDCKKKLDIIRYFYRTGNMEKQMAIDALAALAQETRLDIFRLLVRAGQAGMPAGAIADSLGVPSATLSFHLKELKNAGVVGCQRQGRSQIYTPDFAAMTQLVDYLTENCCQGRGCSPAAAATEAQ